MAAARHPRLYREYGVPDTVDGRFELISLHAILVLRALAGSTASNVEVFRQNLVDEVFRDMDRSLREMGTGDLSVGKKVRKMAEVFYGRLKVYTAALDSTEDSLASALSRNVWPDGGTSGHSRQLARYVREADGRIRAQDPAGIVSGSISFGEPA